MFQDLGWLTWVLVGSLTGWLASILLNTELHRSLLIDVFVGIVGALLCGVFFNLLRAPGATGFNVWSVLVSFIGAVALLTFLRMLTSQYTRI
jgi:uncharacterized membrane protein YeaQ/YmgE (transglycosylase-associated protein family)